MSLYSAAWAGEDENKSKSMHLTWEEVEGIVRYDVTIKDDTDAVVFQKSVDTGSITFSLPPGSYKINIVSINIFGKPSSETGWKPFSIKIKKQKEIKKAESKYVQNLLGIGLKISIGYFYIMPLENWKEYYYNSYVSGLFRMSLIFGNLGLLKNYSFFNHFGLELDSSYIRFTGKERRGQLSFNSHVIPLGGNIFFTTGSSIPINLFVRFGAGIALTRFEYYSKALSYEYNLWSSDPYFLAGISVEITYYKYLYIEAGADFLYIDYIGDYFYGLRYFIMAGIRL